ICPVYVTSNPVEIKLESESINQFKKPWHHICIIGNAQRVSDAFRTHEMWSNQFPSFWFIWGEQSEPNSPEFHKISTITFIWPTAETESSITWAQGIEKVLHLAESKYDCEYYFTHDDDLQFSLRLGADNNSIASILSQTMLKYQPAVAGFPWKFGFDSGMVLYHKSIVSFFIPYSPRGEGGFHGDWSLCAHFLTLFAPSTFKGSTIRLNSIEYENLVTISKTAPKQRSKKEVNSAGLMVQAESRHPYEYKLNKPYEKFLAKGLLDSNQRFGRYIEQVDVDWEVEIRENTPQTADEIRTGRYKHASFDRWKVLENISSFYDITHPILSKNKWIKSSFTDKELLDYRKMRHQNGLDFTLTLHLFTAAQNLTAFENLWKSLNTATKISRKILIEIHVTNRETSDLSSKNLRRIQTLNSIHGTVSVTLNTKNVDPIENLLESWFPSASTEYGMFIFDDSCLVSPHIFEYTEQILFRYNEDSETIMGISLHTMTKNFANYSQPLWNPLSEEKTIAYLLQFPPINGMIVRPQEWTNFVLWFHRLPRGFKPIVPDSAINDWPNNPAEPFLNRFPRKYVSRGQRLQSSDETVRYLRKSQKGKIVGQNARLRIVSLETQEIVFQDQEIIKGLSPLNSLILGRQLKKFDKCTLVLFIQDRTRTAMKRVKYYQRHSLLDSIVVIWNSRENATTLLQTLDSEGNSTNIIPVHVLLQHRKSPNNRFYPFKEIQMSCVVNFDEDSDVCFEDLTRAIRRFQKSDYGTIVRILPSGQNTIYPEFKIGAGVFHAKYLHEYKKVSPSTQAIVNKVGGCADIVFGKTVGKKFVDQEASQQLFQTDDAYLFEMKRNCRDLIEQV
ncbi:exostoses (multiple)-like 2, partial [Physocladia obscura]